MSTEDDKLLNLSEDDLEKIRQVLDGNEEVSPPKSDSESQETEEETEGDTEDQQQEEEEIPADVRVIIDKFSQLDEDEKQLKLKKLEKSGREKQIKAAEIIRSIFNIPNEEQKKLTPEELSLIEKGRQKEREEIISSWIKENNNGLDADKVLSNKNFIKLIYSPEMQGLPHKERIELALFKTFGVKTYEKKGEKDIDTPTNGSISKNPTQTEPFNPFTMDTTMSVEEFLKGKK